MAWGFEAAVERWCGRWVAAVDRRPGRVLAIVGSLTIVLGAFALTHLGVDADPRKLINPNLPFQVRQRELGRTFRALGDGILVVIDAESPTQAAAAANDLAARLAIRRDLFAEVDVPGGGPFFAKNGLLYLTTEQLEDLTDRLSQVQPFLAELARDQSLVAVADLLGQALVAARDGTASGLDLGATLDRVSGVVESVTDGRHVADPWGSAVLGGAMPEEARRRVIALRPVHDSMTLEGAAPELTAIREAARALGLGPERGIRVRVTGEPVLNYEELQAVATQSWHVAVVSVVLFIGTVTFALRVPRLVLALVGSLLVSLVWSNGVAAATVGKLNTISAAFNVLIVGLGGEFGIHFAMRFAELVTRGRTRTRALVEAAESIGGSLVSSAGTTSIGLFIFLLTDFTGVAQLGFIAGTGMFLSLVSTLTVLPAILAAGAPVARARMPTMPGWIARLDRIPLRYAQQVRVGAVVAGLVGLALLPLVRFDYNMVRLHDPHTESVSTFEELLAHSGSSPWTIDVVAPNIDLARGLGRRLERLATVAEVRTVLDYVPADQDEKLEALEMAAFLVPATIMPGPPRTDEDRRRALERLRDEADRTATAAGAVGTSARRLERALVRFDELRGRTNATAALATLERDLVGSLPAQIRDLQQLVSAENVAFVDLPRTLTSRMLAADGRARVEVLARADLSDSRALEAFVEEVRTVAPDAGGLAVYVVEWGEVTWTAMLAALGGGLVLMALFLILLWGSVRDTLLAFFPLALAAVLTCAALVILGEPFNFANVIVLPMLVGMSIDSGVHLVHRHRTNPEEADVLATSTARAVFYSALTTILSFGSLGLAPHRGIAAIGQLLAIGVALVLVSYVVVLPAVLEWDDRRRRSKRPPG
jgi:hypothetical protein